MPAGKNRNLLCHRCGDAGHSVIHQLLGGLALRVAGGEDLAQTCGGAPVVCAYPLQGSVGALLSQCGNGGCRLHSLGSIGVDVGGAQLAVVEALALVVLVGDEVGQHHGNAHVGAVGVDAHQLVAGEGAHLDKEAEAVEEAVRKVLAEGYRTGDIMDVGCTLVGCSKMGDLLAERI